MDQAIRAIPTYLDLYRILLYRKRGTCPIFRFGRLAASGLSSLSLGRLALRHTHTR
jgi:hypothetical protein